MKTACHLPACIAAVGSTFVAAAQTAAPDFKAPLDASIPSGPKGLAIQEGKKLLTDTRRLLPNNVGNGLNCTNCHLDAGTSANASPWVGIWGVFPEYRARSGKVISLIDRVNDCFQRSMNGKALAYNSAEMINILSYTQWLSTAVPTGTAVKGRVLGRLIRGFYLTAQTEKLSMLKNAPVAMVCRVLALKPQLVGMRCRRCGAKTRLTTVRAWPEPTPLPPL